MNCECGVRLTITVNKINRWASAQTFNSLRCENVWCRHSGRDTRAARQHMHDHFCSCASDLHQQSAHVVYEQNLI